MKNCQKNQTFPDTVAALRPTGSDMVVEYILYSTLTAQSDSQYRMKNNSVVLQGLFSTTRRVKKQPNFAEWFKLMTDTAFLISILKG